jgi:SAM-dependent methyltransferase
MLTNYFKLVKEMRDILSLYPWQWNGFYVSVFNRIRLWFNRFDIIEKHIPQKGKIVDIGCGYGLFANFLALRSPDRKIVGIDKNLRKVKYAFRGLKNTQFVAKDIKDFDLSSCQAITMIDFLHHMNSYEEQKDLLSYCYKGLPRGGSLFIKDVCFEPYYKFFLTRIVDNLLYLGDRFYFRRWEEFKALLENMGFKVEYVHLHRGTPYSTYGLSCIKV